MNLSDNPEEVIEKANMSIDILELISQPGDLIDKAGEEYHLILKSSEELDQVARTSLLDLFEKNMKGYYEKTWGYNRHVKEKELFAKHAKYLMIQSKNSELAAWTMFKFEFDDLDEPEYPVLFCHELHVDPRWSRSGLGTQLMKILIRIEEHFQLWKTMLTCFKINDQALKFYASIGFEIDANSPSSFGFHEECYEILSNKPKLK
jgi:GNAT superfamily N-acetyltransferase